MTDKPKPFPEWNSVEDFAVPIMKEIIMSLDRGTRNPYMAFILFPNMVSIPRELTHWMYAPDPPKEEPKRGVWISIADERPPIGLDVLIKYPWGNNFRQARRVEEGKWMFSDSNYDNVGGIVSHWYLPHEFGG